MSLDRNMCLLCSIPVVQQLIVGLALRQTIKDLAKDVKNASKNAFNSISEIFSEKNVNNSRQIRAKTEFFSNIIKLAKGIIMFTPVVGTIFFLGVALKITFLGDSK